MFSKEDIVKRLQNGESTDAIAQEIADTLNEAEAEYKKIREEKTAEAEAEAKRQERLEAKRRIVDDILDLMCDFYVEDENCEMVEMIHGFTTTDGVEMFENIGKMVVALDRLQNLEFGNQEDRNKIWDILFS